MKLHPFSLCLLAMTSQVAADGFDRCFPFEIDENLIDQKHLWYVEVDYLAWFANQQGMSFGTKANISGNGARLNDDRILLTEEQDRFFENRWDSGIRGTFGYTPLYFSWQTVLHYTYFSTKNHHSPLRSDFIFTPNQSFNGLAIIPEYVNVITPTEQSFDIIDISYFLDPVWKLHFNAIDLEFVRQFSLTYDMSLTPSVGLRALLTHQTFQEKVIVDDTTHTIVYLTNFNQHNKFTGIGARVGFDIDYALWEGLELYGNCFAGLIWGYFDVHQKFDQYITTNTILTTLTDETFEHSHQSSLFNLDLAIGFCWNIPFNCSMNRFHLRFGWEQHLFTNMNQFQNFLSKQNTTGTQTSTYLADRNVKRGHLSLSGFVVGLGLDF